MNVLFKYFLALAIVLVLNPFAHAKQHCNAHITLDTPIKRFTINGDVVTDKVTGLSWKRCSVGQSWNNKNKSCDGMATQHNWQNALTVAQQAGGGWRLPNIKELSSIVERKCDTPAINADLFPNIQTERGVYWSSSPYANNNNRAWVVYFHYGDSYGGNKNYNYYVRLVRDSSEH